MNNNANKGPNERFEPALTEFQQSLKLLEQKSSEGLRDEFKHESILLLSQLNQYIGNIQQMQGKYEQAIVEYTKSIQCASDIDIQ